MNQNPQGPHEDVAPILFEHGHGTVHAGLPTHVLKADAEATRGAYSLYEETFPPGHPGPAVHIHHDQEEAFYVIEGELTMLLGERLMAAAAGTFVLVPAGWRHGFANRSEADVRVLNIHSPRGYEGFFAELGAWIARGGDAPSMLRMSREHGAEVTGSPLGVG